MPINKPYSMEDRCALRIIANEFAFNSPKSQSPFFSNRHKCTWLISFTILFLIKYSRSLLNDQRPYGKPIS